VLALLGVEDISTRRNLQPVTGDGRSHVVGDGTTGTQPS
jgi:hypothetical protein